jgi:hypothetical protein
VARTGPVRRTDQTPARRSLRPAASRLPAAGHGSRRAPVAPEPVTARGHRTAHPTWRGDAVAAVASATLVAVTALWLANRGGQDLAAGAGTGLTSAGRLLGLWSADLLLLQVLAMRGSPGRNAPGGRTGWPAGTGSLDAAPSI